MKILKRLREVFFALLPILAIVLFVHFFVYRFETKLIVNFIISLLIICAGEVLLLTGIDSTVMPMGELMVSSVNSTKRLILFIVFTMVFGICATIAEPDVTVFSSQLVSAGVSVPKFAIVVTIGLGVGIFIVFGILKIMKHVEIKYVYLVIFAIIFLLCTGVDSKYIAVAFDAGGATTGIVTAPFLLAVSTGVSNRFVKQKSENDVFGMVGMASLGPIISVLIIFLIAGKAGVSETLTESAVNLFVDNIKNTALAIIPLTVVFLVYDLAIIKLPLKKRMQYAFGLIVTAIGLYLFLISIDYGVSNMGTAFGDFLRTMDVSVVIIFCVLLGFVITFSEPSVLVLSKQVQTVTKGNISSFVVLISIAISMALALVVSALKIIFNINFFYIILCGYALAIVLMFFVPSIFTCLAFDSGGVASGPMTSAFILPIMLGIASASAGDLAGFGVIGIVGMCPIVVLQILGLVYKVEVYRKTRQEKKHALKLVYSTELYSNIDMLEKEYNQMLKEKNNEKEK